MTLIVIARFFFVKIKITLGRSPKKRPAITKKNLAITKIFDFRAVFWHITWISRIFQHLAEKRENINKNWVF